MKKIQNAIVMLLLVLLGGCVSAPPLAPSRTEIQLLATYTIPTGTVLGEYVIGGLSAIAVLPDGRFISLSDARSTDQEGPSRFYSGRIILENGIMSDLKLESDTPFHKPDGSLFAKKERDPEAFVLASNGNLDELFFASERSNTLELAVQGTIVNSMDRFLPDYYYGEEGLRSNQGIEGMSLSPEGRTSSEGTFLFLDAESALVRDGDVATLENPAVSRILKLKKTATGYNAVAEYAYSVSKIPTASTEFDVQDNGVSDILALDDHRLLVVERNGYAVKPNYAGFDFTIRAYIVDLSQGENILGQDKIPTDVQLVSKKLLFNLSDFVAIPDNVEGIAFGPDIGRDKTIFLVSDNNFSEHQATKFYQLAIPLQMLYP